jgi:antitoxin HicB
MTQHKVEDYLTRPYHIEVIYDDSGEAPGWFARVAEFPGCMTQTRSAEELLPMIRDAMYSWIEIGLEDGQPIPEPFEDEAYSGKFVVRVPRSLHRQLAEAAERDNVSLNTFVTAALAKAIGAADAAPVVRKQPAKASARRPAARGVSAARR